MSWQEKYRDKLYTAAEAAEKFIHDGDTVCASGGAANTLVKAMTSRILGGGLRDITFDGNICLYDVDISHPGLAESGFRYKSYFFGPYERAGAKAGITAYVPVVYSAMSRYYQKHRPDVVLAELTPPDENGNCNIGCMLAGTGPYAMENAKTIIGSVNPRLARSCGYMQDIPADRVTAFVENEKPMPAYPVALPDETDRRICDLILDHVPDGACVQLGIGGMPNALGYGLRAKKHLGIHTEMLTASLIELMKCGAADNSRKKYMPGKSVCGFALGQQEQYDFIDGNPDLYFLPHELCNDPRIIAENDNVISVNNALEINLFGAVAADCVGYREYSGVGGQIDFVRGAAYSKGGKSFIAMRSTFKDKDGENRSHIVLDLGPGTQVTTLRSEVMYVVTEFGCVDLWGEDVPTRAKRLISIAHPDFRDELTYKAKKAGVIY